LKQGKLIITVYTICLIPPLAAVKTPDPQAMASEFAEALTTNPAFSTRDARREGRRLRSDERSTRVAQALFDASQQTVEMKVSSVDLIIYFSMNDCPFFI